MKKKILMRLTVTLLLVGMVASLLVGCASDEGDLPANSNADPAADSGVTPETDPAEELRYDKDGYLMDDLPEDLRYVGQRIKILAWDDSSVAEFNVDKISTNSINNSIYVREQTIKTRLGVELDYVMTAGSVKKINDYKEKVSIAYSANDPYDIIASYTRSTAICATAGYLLDLGHVENNYMDYEKPWWNQSIIDKTSTIDGKFYFVTGDASTSLAQMTYCVYFNADEVDRMQQTSPYEMVKNNTWTLENMRTMTKTYYLDNNGDKTVDIEDNLGLVGTYYDWPALLHGCGVGIIQKDVTGEFVLDPTIKTGRGLTVMETLDKWITNEGSFVSAPDSGINVMKNFTSGKSMFIITESGAAISQMQDVSFEYGCVPCPKYEADQEAYYSTVRQPITLFGIMSNVKEDRVPMITAVLECWGSEGYRKTTPAIFESAMKDQSSTSAYMTEMLQLIKDTAWFDCGRIYALETNYVCDEPGKYLASGTPWENYVSTQIPNLESTFIPLLSDMLNR